MSLDCDDQALSRRFNEIYPEGTDTDPEAADVYVKCVVRGHGDLPVAAVTFEDPEPLDAFAFCKALFPDRGYVDGPPAAPGWRTIAARESPDRPVVALSGNFALADRRQVWQPFIANYAVNRVLRLQRDILFFHAASIGIAGRGALIVGPKASGKTTTSLTLASRGCDFLGDEMAAVHKSSKMIFPFRRAVSIRSGRRARLVDQKLAEGHFSVERFPDGGARVLANVSELFPQAGVAQSELSCAFFLRHFAERPHAEPFLFGSGNIGMLSPLACSMWGVPAGARILDLSRLMRGVRCYYLHPGPPEDTAELVEQVVRGRAFRD